MLNKLKPLYHAARDFIADFECAEKHDGAGDYSESRSKSDTINSADQLVDAVVAYGKQRVYDAAPMDRPATGQTDTPSERPAIPHADLIRAVLDGKVVLGSKRGYSSWSSETQNTLYSIGFILDHSDWDFRLKPEPVVRWIPIFNTVSGISVIVGNTEEARKEQGQQCDTKEQALEALHPHDQMLMRGGRHGKLLRVEFDPDTLEVINARTEAP